MRLRRLPLGLLAGFSVVCICSCALVNHVTVPAKPAPISPAQAGPAIKPAPKPVPKPVFDADAVAAEAQNDISKGMYEDAFNLYREALGGHPGNRKLISGYDNGLQAVKKAADKEFEKRDFAAAGGLYWLLARNYTRSAVSAETGYLKDRIRYCSNMLTETGLASYRKGDLKGAITAWDSVLKFDPDNLDAKKALDTAKKQLKNLSK